MIQLNLKAKKSILKRLSYLTILGATVALSSCGPTNMTGIDHDSEMIVSVRDQSMLLLKKGKPEKIYPISTSKFGLGSQSGSNRTPLGRMEVAQKIGNDAHVGAVFKGRRPTGEVIRPNAPGRDPIVTRIMWLKGNEHRNNNAYSRYIYIHGTPEERTIGSPASYGCIRMKSNDVIDLYRRIGVGADVNVIRGSLNRTPEGRKYYARYGPLQHVRGVSLKFNSSNG
jgi:lipoprotein-anchoring transpeptidase ErfK/SrfK